MLDKVPATVRESLGQIHPEWWNHIYTDALGFIGTDFARKGDLESVHECANQFPPKAELSKMEFLCNAAEAVSANGDKADAHNILEEAATILEEKDIDLPNPAAWLNKFASASIKLGETDRARTAIEKRLTEVRDNSRSLAEYELMSSLKELAAFYIKNGDQNEAMALVNLCSDPRWQGHLLLSIARALPDEKQAQEIIAQATNRITAIDYPGYQEEVRAEVVKTKAARGNLDEAFATMKKPEEFLEAYARIEFARFTFAKNGKEAAESVLREIKVDERSIWQEQIAYLLVELARAEMQFGDREAAKGFLARGVKAANASYRPNSAYAEETDYQRKYALEAVGRAMADIGEADDLKKLGTSESQRDIHDFMFAQAIRAELSRG